MQRRNQPKQKREQRFWWGEEDPLGRDRRFTGARPGEEDLGQQHQVRGKKLIPRSSTLWEKDRRSSTRWRKSRGRAAEDSREQGLVEKIQCNNMKWRARNSHRDPVPFGRKIEDPVPIGERSGGQRQKIHWRKGRRTRIWLNNNKRRPLSFI